MKDATGVIIWQDLTITERTFRRLGALEVAGGIAGGVFYVLGEQLRPSQTTAEKKAAAWLHGYTRLARPSRKGDANEPS